jgi:hypothetical protein
VDEIFSITGGGYYKNTCKNIMSLSNLLAHNCGNVELHGLLRYIQLVTLEQDKTEFK